ncbi:1-acyl-sn-glycerol-3-phosphate acyltransferase [Shimia sp. MMG029]|uniref:1-acyl-sn-glycerol-3-phosphate acyltransferase n=1 Tax=Shimia sp. MMG029 TaxID=3021978 RepID=UPI0022FDD4C3|nr:1-acyl-sn-glycerol-3-phosphate acyltransferase [Shimia sp. MMG029]MDA5558383.1 1-acyl-sn-glycerol-3-phosphate acyltransferase [Shimia sp. MMG029]
MTSTVELPVWLFGLILLFAIVTAASHLLFPSVRWFFRRRMERAVAHLNERLQRPIEPFKLAQRHDMIQRLIYQPDVTRAVAEHARAKGIPDAVAFEEAKRYAREIVPSFSAFMYFGVAIRLTRFFSRALYHVRVGFVDEAAIDALPQDATVVYVMNHRSNMDYVLVTYLAARRSALTYAVGEWARVWPLSRLIRALGAYFIRRRSHSELYRKVLAAYVRLATEAGVTQAMFPEGRLSLDGAPQEPKRGLLKYITDAYDPEARDVVFVPVALNYDRILEDRILLEAKARGGKGFRARISVILGFFLKQIWLRCLGKYRKFGTAEVRFGHPLSLAEFVKYHPTSAGEDLAEPLSLELMGRINAVVPVLSVPLVAAILEDAAAPMTLEEIKAAYVAHMDHLGETAQQAQDCVAGDATETGLRILVGRRMIGEDDNRYFKKENQRDELAFYANSIRHLLE